MNDKNLKKSKLRVTEISQREIKAGTASATADVDAGPLPESGDPTAVPPYTGSNMSSGSKLATKR